MRSRHLHVIYWFDHLDVLQHQLLLDSEGLRLTLVLTMVYPYYVMQQIQQRARQSRECQSAVHHTVPTVSAESPEPSATIFTKPDQEVQAVKEDSSNSGTVAAVPVVSEKSSLGRKRGPWDQLCKRMASKFPCTSQKTKASCRRCTYCTCPAKTDYGISFSCSQQVQNTHMFSLTEEKYDHNKETSISNKPYI